VGQQHTVVVEASAGAAAFFPDAEYQEAGAQILGSSAEVCAAADLVLTVQRLEPDAVGQLRSGCVLVCLMSPHTAEPLLDALAARGVTALALELVPRTTKAQSMDVLSSQATVAGYQAVLLGASRMGRFLPMLTTAAGTIIPARAFVIGAGVAGLQAIATARRLGAVVSAFDVRAVVKEQVESLGAVFLEIGATAEGTGGYAKELAADDRTRVNAGIAAHLADIDLVITTAAIPGKPAPRLIARKTLASMRPGSVIVDLAAESGGNCEATRAGEDVVESGVTVVGPVNLPSTLPYHASFMLSRNIQALIEYANTDGAFAVDLEDAIVGPMCVVHGGAVRYGRS
jgi:NAD(P) transhydrogenase subunit alpha